MSFKLWYFDNTKIWRLKFLRKSEKRVKNDEFTESIEDDIYIVQITIELQYKYVKMKLSSHGSVVRVKLLKHPQL